MKIRNGRTMCLSLRFFRSDAVFFIYFLFLTGVSADDYDERFGDFFRCLSDAADHMTGRPAAGSDTETALFFSSKRLDI